MPDYQPLDLTTHYNAATDFIREGAAPPIGDQLFHGLPFCIGSDPARCLIGFSGGAGGPIEVAVGTTARRVLFAHSVIESRILEGEPVGRIIAHYVFRYEDGAEVRVPIRERFEIQFVPTTWGQSAFLAVPDQKNTLMPRYEGRWSEMGRRQTEATQGWPKAYFIWAWENPDPTRVLSAIRIEPGDRKFVLAAITLGHADENPFTRDGMTDVRVTLPDPTDAAKPFQLEVDVDRGVAGYPYALPAQSEDTFLADPQKGWGERQNPAASPAYVQISAIPSATVEVKQDGESLGRANWGELRTAGKLELPRVALEVLDRGKNWVHVTVVDDATGEPVPCRVHFRSPEGIPYQPHGHHTHVNGNLGTWHVDIGGDLRMGQISYAYIDGKCQGWLPRGDVLVDVARGFEYEPLRSRVRVEPGQRELVLRLKRWTNMSAKGWYSGDTHVHCLGTQGAHREAKGEDLNVVNLLQSQWGHLFTNTEDFIGRPTVSDDGHTIVYCTQENRQHFLGHLTLLGLKEPVMPWCTDGPGEAELGGTLEETMSAWADACHKQGGTVVIPHLPTPNGEPAVLIATGRADAVEMLRQAPYEHHEYYRYLNCGYRLPLVGGTDKMTSDVPVGIYRTYADLRGEELTYDNWCRAVREGRTFLSGGPLIRFRVEGAEVGDTLSLPAGGGTVEVEAVAEGIFPLHLLEIIQEGRVVAAVTAAEGSRRLELREKLHVNRHTWLAARCGGPDYKPVPHYDGWQRGIFAHTSPVYVACGGEWWMFDLEAAQYMLTLVHGGLDYIRHMAPLHKPGTVTHHHHHDNHAEYLEEPFRQAMDAIHRRMHQLNIPH